MLKRAVLVLLLLLAFSSLASADEPPSWVEFEVKSANGKFIAEIKARSGQENKDYHEREYELSVYELAGAGRRKLWSATYRYDGYPGGMLSDDGAAFVYVNFWYYRDRPAVSIYRAGQSVKAIRGSEFEIDPSAIQETVSHKLWLSDEPRRVEFSSSGARSLILLILTRDKRLHQVDVATGQLLK